MVQATLIYIIRLTATDWLKQRSPVGAVAILEIHLNGQRALSCQIGRSSRWKCRAKQDTEKPGVSKPDSKPRKRKERTSNASSPSGRSPEDIITFPTSSLYPSHVRSIKSHNSDFPSPHRRFPHRDRSHRSALPAHLASSRLAG